MSLYTPTCLYFAGNARILACANDPPRPIYYGEQGEHVYALQRALQKYYYDYGMFIDNDEYYSKKYGPSTRVFVQSFKADWPELRDHGRNTPSATVGKKTIQRLDSCINDMLDPRPDVPNPPRPPTPPAPKQPAKLPGGARFNDWQVGSIIGVQLTLGAAAGGVSIVAFRRKSKPGEQFLFAVPQGGGAAGAGYSYSGGKILKLIIKTITSFSGNYTSEGSLFGDVPWNYSFNKDDLAGLTFTQTQSGGGVFVAGYQRCIVSIYGQFWHNEKEYGEASRKTETLLSPSASTGWGFGGDMVGVGISTVGGPLIYLGTSPVNLP